jgi:hypothetical protein
MFSDLQIGTLLAISPGMDQHRAYLESLDDPTVRRFLAKIEFVGECWIWKAGKSKGYGRFSPTPDSNRYSHRVAYEWCVGPVPEGLELDHYKCLIRACCNPAHVEPVTSQVNIQRSNGPAGVNYRKAICKHGHLFDEDNTGYLKSGKRYCRACTARRAKERRGRGGGTPLRGRSPAYRDHRKAYLKVAKAVAAGLLFRPDTCEKCGRGGRIEAHHQDYGKPLDVLWYCRRCNAVAG